MSAVEEGRIGDVFGHPAITDSSANQAIEVVMQENLYTKPCIKFPETPLFEGNTQVLVLAKNHLDGETFTILIPPVEINKNSLTFAKSRDYLHATKRSKRS